MWSHTERQADNDVYVVTQRGRLTMTCMWSHTERQADSDVYVVTHREAG